MSDTGWSTRANAKAVVDLATFVDELKARAGALAAAMDPQARGFFTPAEDLQVRQLFVSYTQVRRALFDVCYAYLADRKDDDFDSDPQAFLVAYAAAILLVDAARSLREMFHEFDVVRDKLNEAEPVFGIAHGTYDAIQKSLTDPVHAWHLYHANAYFDQHEQALNNLAGDADVSPVAHLVRQRRHRVQVSASDYAKARARIRLREMRTKLAEGSLARAAHALQEWVMCWMADVRVVPGHRPGLPPAIADELTALLQPGDVIVVRKEHAVTNYFLPGFWPHAALYLGTRDAVESLGISDHQHVLPRLDKLMPGDDGQPHRVLESMKDGVLIRSIASPYASDSIAVIRAALPQPLIARAICNAMMHEGKGYDFDMDFSRSDRLVCTEVVYRGFDGLEGVTFNPVRRVGRYTVSAEDLLNMALAKQVFAPLAIYVRGRGAKLYTGDRAARVLRTTLGDRARPGDHAVDRPEST